ncbi:hypothetical protein R1flu_016247 [Riccia fluitans]|uniref:Transmembrane protein n=1 Tax=Riccia fluitans TaxID=41844 RepID=A0ABD1YLA9_9MARC
MYHSCSSSTSQVVRCYPNHGTGGLMRCAHIFISWSSSDLLHCHRRLLPAFLLLSTCFFRDAIASCLPAVAVVTVCCLLLVEREDEKERGSSIRSSSTRFDGYFHHWWLRWWRGWSSMRLGVVKARCCWWRVGGMSFGTARLVTPRDVFLAPRLLLSLVFPFRRAQAAASSCGPITSPPSPSCGHRHHLLESSVCFLPDLCVFLLFIASCAFLSTHLFSFSTASPVVSHSVATLAFLLSVSSPSSPRTSFSGSE